MSPKNDESSFDNNEFYRTAVESSPIATIVHCGGIITFANDAAGKLYGTQHKDEMLGISILDIVHPDFHKTVMARVKTMIEDGRATPMAKLKCLRITGEVLDVEVRSAPITYGDKISVLVTIQDITDREAYQEGLRIFSRVVEQSPNSIVITDRSGLITFVNPRFEKLTGYTKEEVLGQNPRILQSGMTPAEVYKEMWAKILLGDEWRGTLCNKKRDGSLYWEYVVISGLEDSTTGEVTHFIAVKNDITKKRQYEEELRQHRDQLQSLVEERTAELVEAKELAESANSAKSAFLANMSHEIRTPMNGIIGMSHILRRNGVTPEQDRSLRVIETSGQHLLGVINNILDISKIEAGVLLLEEEPVDISKLLSNVSQIHTEQAKKKGVRLLIEDLHFWPPNVVGDVTRLQQALINYIGNAIKFTNQGTIVVRATKEEESPASIVIRFEVIDNGIGISPESMSKLFNVFEQLDNSMTRKYGGTGLGLSITKRLASLMGGEVGAESELGKGSTFWLTVRLKKIERRENLERASSEVPAEDVLRNNHSGKIVLVADDEPINREIAEILLGSAGVVVHLANDGEEAIELAKQISYSVIFMDMQMPRVNGLEATKAIHALEKHNKTPIIAVTANATHKDKKMCLEFGMSDFITKPFSPEELFEILLKWITK